MKCLLSVSIFMLIFCVSIYEAKDLLVGSRENKRLISTQKVVNKGTPLLITEQDYTYTDPKQRIIKAIIARDLSRTDTTAEVKSGGEGSSHVTIHFKSGRGQKINYLILLFAEE
ncbi:transcription activator MBF2 domain-containing protein [Phthorimaea operculella]|nr:transcription activator MBF2 domain-containing protein [Phthorimaea operculella]